MQGRWMTGWMMVTLCVLLASKTQAAFTDSFDALRGELVSRASVLSNSDDKVEIKQYKACLKAVAAIDKSSTLANDIKTAAKITKSLAKTFTNDFNVATAQATLASVTFSNNLQTLVTGTFSNLADEVQAALDGLQTAINGLPAGSAKVSAQALHDAAQSLVNSGNPDLLAFAKSLATAVKDVIKGAKIAAKGSGGGSCGTITTSIVTMTVQNAAWSASFPTGFAGGEYLVSTGFFNVGGTAADGSAMGLSVDSGVTGPGTYPIATNSAYTIGSPPTQAFTVTSGTITIIGLDVGTWTACGTATFSATDGVTPITVTNVEFAVKDLGHE